MLIIANNNNNNNDNNNNNNTTTNNNNSNNNNNKNYCMVCSTNDQFPVKSDHWGEKQNKVEHLTHNKYLQILNPVLEQSA